MKTRNILLFQSRFSANETEKAIHLLASQSTNVSALIVKPKKGISQKLDNAPPTYFRDDLLKNNYVTPQYPKTDTPYRVLQLALKDPSTADIVHRQFGPNLFNSKIILLTCLFNIDSLFRKHAISACVSHVVPHNVVGWLCTTYCSYLDIPHYFMRESIIPGRAVLVRDGVNPVVIGMPENLNPIHREAKSHINNILQLRQGDYADFIPKYELQRRSADRTALSRLAGDLKQILKRPKTTLSIYRKWNRRINLEQLCHSHSKGEKKPLIGFFLHYQPERTTFPEAGHLSQQYIMAAMLSQKAAEENGSVIIKEHPSQILLSSGWEFRNNFTYKEYVALKSVQFASPLSEPTELIDKCDVIVSCGGTVILESLARGRPVIYFNRIKFIEVNGVIHVSDFRELCSAIDEITSGDVKVEIDELKSNLIKEYNKTIAYNDGDTGYFSDDFFKAVNHILSTD